MPSQQEQDDAAWYVLRRPLVRPNTSYKKAAIYILLFLLANIAMTVLLITLFYWLGISSFMPSGLSRFYNSHYFCFVALLAAFQFTLSSILTLKSAIIGAIRLYQRYAPERIRRKCMFKPTCSEYAILSIQKYGVIRGLLKTRDRLFNRCKGRIYMIDEP